MEASPLQIVRTNIYCPVCVKGQEYCQRKRHLDLAGERQTWSRFSWRHGCMYSRCLTRSDLKQQLLLSLWRTSEGSASFQTKQYSKATEDWRQMAKTAFKPMRRQDMLPSVLSETKCTRAAWHSAEYNWKSKGFLCQPWKNYYCVSISW